MLIVHVIQGGKIREFSRNFILAIKADSKSATHSAPGLCGGMSGWEQS